MSVDLIAGIIFGAMLGLFSFGLVLSFFGLDKGKFFIPILAVAGIVGGLIGGTIGYNTQERAKKETIERTSVNSKQLGEFVNYANSYYENNKEYGSLDAISLEFPKEFTDQTPLYFPGNNIESDYRINKIPTGAIVVFDDYRNITIRILLKRGNMVGLSCDGDQIVNSISLCKLATKNIRRVTSNTSNKRVSCSKNNLTAEECARVNSAL